MKLDFPDKAFLVGVVFILVITLAVGLIVVFVAVDYFTREPICTTTIECRDLYVQECLALERYSRDECIRLASGK